MSLIHPTSLAQTLDAVNEAFFFGKQLAKAEKEEAANWLAGRQGLPRLDASEKFARRYQECSRARQPGNRGPIIKLRGPRHLLLRQMQRRPLAASGRRWTAKYQSGTLAGRGRQDAETISRPQRPLGSLSLLLHTARAQRDGASLRAQRNALCRAHLRKAAEAR